MAAKRPGVAAHGPAWPPPAPGMAGNGPPGDELAAHGQMWPDQAHTPHKTAHPF